jgi:HEAT repeat protein
MFLMEPPLPNAPARRGASFLDRALTDPLPALLAALDDDSERTTATLGFAGVFDLDVSQVDAQESSRSCGSSALANGIAARLFQERIPLARRMALARTASALALDTAPLLSWLERSDDAERTIAALALAAPRHLEAVPALVRSLGDLGALPSVRAAAAEALAAIGDASVTAAIAAALDDESALVRRAAVVALRTLDAARCAPAFLHGARDDDVDVRCASLAALLAVGGAVACAAARTALADVDGAVRAMAVVVLARHGGTRDSDSISALADDVDVRVRRAAREAATVLVA